MRSCAVAALAFLALASPAAAADVVEPQSGATVSSRPSLTFDFARGSALVEFSRSPETKLAGDDVGAFVEQYASDFIIVGGDAAEGPPYVFTPIFPARLAAGRYYWHVKADDDADDSQEGGAPPVTWGPLRTIVVADEPAVIEGWTARVQRLRPRGKRCRTRLRIRGTIAWSDNDDTAIADYTVRLRAGGRVLGRVRGRFGVFDRTYDGVVCSRRRSGARRVTATVSLRDKGREVTTSPGRRISVRRR